MAQEQQTEKEEKSTNNVKIAEILSDQGKNALMNICALELCTLYGDRHERRFVKKYISDLTKDLEFTQAKNDFLEALMADLDKDGEKDILFPCSLNAFVEKLKIDCDNRDENISGIVKSLVLLSLGTGRYDARHRVLLFSISKKLGIPNTAVEDIEHELISHLKTLKDQENREHNDEYMEQQSSRNLKRGLMIGLGAIGGGALLGFTGGLVAPFLAAGVGTLFGSGVAVALGSVKGIAIICTSLFGAAGAGLTGFKINRRVGSITQFEFGRLTGPDHMNATIAISGWLPEQDQSEVMIAPQCGFEAPWRLMNLGREQYYLKWESTYLQELGDAISSFITSSAISNATDQVVNHTILQGIASAIMWPLAVTKFGYIIDNPWGVCASRSVEVGKHLAYVLTEGHHGNRPVTLVGFGFGARVIFNCLKEMTKMKDSDWLIQDVILIGAPVSGHPQDWQGLEKVVAGKIVNCYCRNDWLLKFVYRAASVQGRVAGLKPVMWQNRRMINVNIGDLIKHHTEYCSTEKIQQILEAIPKIGVCPLDIDASNSSSSEGSGITLTQSDLQKLDETMQETVDTLESSKALGQAEDDQNKDIMLDDFKEEDTQLQDKVTLTQRDLKELSDTPQETVKSLDSDKMPEQPDEDLKEPQETAKSFDSDKMPGQPDEDLKEPQETAKSLDSDKMPEKPDEDLKKNQETAISLDSNKMPEQPDGDLKDLNDTPQETAKSLDSDKMPEQPDGDLKDLNDTPKETAKSLDFNKMPEPGEDLKDLPLETAKSLDSDKMPDQHDEDLIDLNDTSLETTNFKSFDFDKMPEQPDEDLKELNDTPLEPAKSINYDKMPEQPDEDLKEPQETATSLDSHKIPEQPGADLKELNDTPQETANTNLTKY